MGTRGLCGFRKNGIDKLMYVQFDSYPEELGRDVVKFCLETKLEELNEIFGHIILVDGDTTPTKKQIAECKPWTDLKVAERNTKSWYCLVRKAQGNLSAYKEGLRYMLDAAGFIKESLFCQHGYIINLDDNTLEYWRGFQETPQNNNRYGTDCDEGFYPCKKVMTFPLNSIPEDAVSQMILVEKNN